MSGKRIARLQPITNEASSLPIEEQVEAFCQGGADWVQLRVKNASREAFTALAEEARKISQAYGAKLIIDDRYRIAEQIGADGVHVGEKDEDPIHVRELIGEQAIIGGTADRFERIQHLADRTDYVGCGPFRFTSTKKALSPVLGLEGYRKLLRKMKEERIEIPIIAIGGVLLEDIPDLLAEGLYGVAISSAITEARDPVRETERYVRTIQEGAH